MKKFLYWLFNGFLLKPFNAHLSFNIGKNALSDLKLLLNGRSVFYVIDGGAYHGDFTAEVLQKYSGAKIFAFEPQKNSFSKLAANYAHHDRVVPVKLALGKSNGNANLYENKSAMTNSLLKNTDDAIRYFSGYNDPVGEEIVEVVSLADFMNREGIDKIDLLKLDLQGYELNALIGMRDRLKDVGAIYIEVEFLHIYQEACIFSDVEQYLRSRDFIFFQFYNLVRSPENGRLLYGDALFINSHYFKV